MRALKALLALALILPVAASAQPAAPDDREDAGRGRWVPRGEDDHRGNWRGGWDDREFGRYRRGGADITIIWHSNRALWDGYHTRCNRDFFLRGEIVRIGGYCYLLRRR